MFNNLQKNNNTKDTKLKNIDNQENKQDNQDHTLTLQKIIIAQNIIIFFNNNWKRFI
jgi:hypothetical protein